MSDHDFTNIAPPHTPPISVSSTTTEQNLTGSWKYIRPAYHDRVAPCVAGCPTAVDVQGYMTMLREGRVAAACELLLGENPMPAVTGRVCNHPCEEDCNRAFFDGAVAIHAVERMLGDRILQTPLPESLPVTRAERIAVIGSGPAGLACAYHLRRLGYAVEVFEQADHAGGMLRMGIPEYRLPRAVLDAQIERIQAQYRKVAEKGEPLGSIQANMTFHACLADLTENSYLINALDEIRDLTNLAGLRSLEVGSRTGEAIEEHEQIVAELKRQSLSGALREMESHIRTTEARVLARIRTTKK